jgi:hypothetical protein
MSTTITALIIIICTIGIPLIFILIHKKKNNQRNKTLLNLFSQEGARQGLSFSIQELFRNKIIGLDSTKQTVMVFEFANTNNIICIPMADVKNCTIEKKYDSIVIGTEKKPKIEPHLRSIDLEFSFKNRSAPRSVSFFDSSVNSIYEMSELESKAKTWEAMLSGMIFKEQREIA